MNSPSYKPRCPNHGEPLEGIGFPIPQKGTGICPVSGAEFEFEVDVNETSITKDINGNLIKKADWKVVGNEI